MAITREQANKLFNFLGYGNPEATFWFIGMEEGTSGEDAITENLRVRIEQFTEVMDLHVAHDEQHLNWPICQQSKYPSVWVFMGKIVAALKNENDWTDTQKAKKYICDHLGRAADETFLTEMLPLPKRSANNWPALYEELFPTREKYEDKIRPYRAKLLNNLIGKHHPRFVFCYGETHYIHFKAIAGLPLDSWKPLSDTKIQVSRSEDTIFVLTPFLGNGRIGNKALQILFDDLKH